jgi:protoheme IX farnesyltransferase
MSSAAVNPDPGLLPTFRDLVALTKPRVSTLVLATAACGIGFAPGAISAGSVVWMLLGTLLCVGSANALNCFLERDLDKRMRRTQDRPLPAGRLGANLALGFGLSLGIASIPVLALGTNMVTGMLGLLALASYVVIYTPMKTQSPYALIVGAIPGALPPLMGYAAVTGHIAPKGLVLFALSFLWQIPHVIGLAAYRREEYVAAGIKVVPAVYAPPVVRAYAVSAGLVLLAVSTIPVWAGWAGRNYLIVAALLGAAYVGAALRGPTSATLAVWGRRLFLVSLVYLPLLFAALLIDGRT